MVYSWKIMPRLGKGNLEALGCWVRWLTAASKIRCLQFRSHLINNVKQISTIGFAKSNDWLHQENRVKGTRS